MIYHITTKNQWEEETPLITAQSLETEGFIHACTREQLAGVLERHFPGRSDLVILALDPSRLNIPLRWEAPAAPVEGQTHFPHLYGPINREAISGVIPYDDLDHV